MKFEDTPAPFDLVARHGFYQVGQANFSTKILALQHASRTGLPIYFNFNDDTYGRIDWRQQPAVPLTELYRQRAFQLRDRYSYLVLCWSGGADSTQILDTFLDNNILLDEILVIWPVTRTKGRYQPSFDTSNTNMLSEWDFVIRPRLESLRTTHPRLRITIADMLINPNPIEDQEDTIKLAEKHNYVTIQRCRDIDAVLESRMKQHNHVAAIMGTGPVDPVILDDHLAVWFLDSATNPFHRSDITARGWLRNIEYFYWTPDMPEIAVKQAHVLADHLDHVPNDRLYLMNMSINAAGHFQQINSANPEMVRRLRKQLFYPKNDPTLFQVVKATDHYVRFDHHAWFYDDPHSLPFLQPWHSHIRSQQALIDSKYFRKIDDTRRAYVHFRSKPYAVRKLRPVSPTGS